MRRSCAQSQLMRVLMRRRQQIGQVELVGAVAPYLSLPSELAGRRVIHFIDNTSALAALVKGTSGTTAWMSSLASSIVARRLVLPRVLRLRPCGEQLGRRALPSGVA